MWGLAACRWLHAGERLDHLQVFVRSVVHAHAASCSPTRGTSAMGTDIAVRQVSVRALGDDGAIAARLRAAREAAGGDGAAAGAPSQATSAAAVNAGAALAALPGPLPSLQLPHHAGRSPSQQQQQPLQGGAPVAAASVAPARTIISDAVLESLASDDTLHLLSSSKSAPAFAFSEAVTTARDFPDEVAANVLIAVAKCADAIAASCIALPRR